MPRAWAEIDLEAVRHNVRTLRRVASPARLCAVVKANGYGHGAAAVGRAALEAGADWLAVAQVEEAVALRDAGSAAPRLLLSEPRIDEVEDAVSTGAHLTVYSSACVAAVAKAVLAARVPAAPLHLKVDTGMRRVGVAPGDVLPLARAITELAEVRLAGVCTHCPVADEPDDPFTHEQLRRFDEIVAELREAGIDPGIVHAANSAATILHPESRHDMVRCGIAVYGIPPAPALAGLADLKPTRPPAPGRPPRRRAAAAVRRDRGAAAGGGPRPGRRPRAVPGGHAPRPGEPPREGAARHRRPRHAARPGAARARRPHGQGAARARRLGRLA